MIVTEPTINELQHIADLAKGRLDNLFQHEGDVPSEWELTAIQNMRGWLEALENLSPQDQINLATQTLLKFGIDVKSQVLHESIEKVFVISTAHVKQSTAAALEQGSEFGLTIFTKAQYGWWIYCGDISGASPMPNELLTTLKHAKALGCTWLCLDRDADHITELEAWEW